MIHRRAFLQTFAAAPAALLGQGRKPNLIVILADDMGYGDLGCYGSPDVPTPHIDSIGRNGVRFTDGYVSCAVCSPSRAALLTGRYQHRFGHEFNSGSIEREAEVGFGLPPSERILPQYLKPAGYRSMAIGKWHLGARAGYHPLERGFDEFFGFLTGGNAFVTKRTPGGRAVGADGQKANIPAERADPIRRGRQPVAEDRYLTDAFGDEAVRFVERNKANPFFLYLAPNAIHTPLHTIERYLDRFANIQNEKHRLLAAMTSALDDNVGALLAKLRETGLEKNTLVVFLSDNGCPVVTGAGSNKPLNGQKVTYFEGGIRVPFMMQWPGRIPAGKIYREPIVSRDILPTFLAAAGVPTPSGVTLDGVNLLPFLTGGGTPHDTLFWRGGKARAVRRGKWKLLEYGDHISNLYDLSNDVGEKNDLSGKHPEVVKDLRAAFDAWSAKMVKPAWPPRYRELTVNGITNNWEL
ncbi:MAG TPA: sulfatase-like hydrolase/transferase [Bryobacteraceae bacterium]|nr:sulfatase-like hydrolase/transferase [Bryobacteraceae bacterium]